MLQLGRKLLRRLAWTGDDRRAHPRHTTDIRTVCRPVSEEADIPARIADVSVGGVKLRIGRPLREGTMVRVELPRLGGPGTTVLACVMHANEVSRGEWEIGCNFSLELSDDEMQAFGAEKTQAAPADSRAWVRYPARGLVEYEVLPGDDGPPRTGQLVNLSPAGVGLLVDEKLEAGTALTLFLKRVDDQGDRQLLACVVYQTERPDGTWAVGCNFLHELGEKELDELLWLSHF
jgi:hypothetical protein